jgi:hypothetical protein
MSNRNDHTHIKMISSFEDLMSVFRQCNDNILMLHQYSSDDFMGLNARIRYFHKQATEILQIVSAIAEKNGKQTDVSLVEQAKKSLYCISSIITKLQFHDIIRQKLEHIQDTNQYILEELLLASNTDSANTAQLQNAYIPIIPDIIRLHIAQLKGAKSTYRQAFAEIKSHLNSIIEINCSLAETYSETNNTVHSGKGSRHLSEKIISLSQKFTAETTHSLAAIKHCEAFDALANDTGKKLIACTIQPSLLKTDSRTNLPQQTLKNLELLYTMESERVIFNQVLNGGQLTDIQKNKLEDASENIELF